MLSSVCVILRGIFPPHLPTRVSIHCDARPQHIRQRLSAFAECPALLRNISEIEVETWSPVADPRGPLYLNFRAAQAISAFLRIVPHMPQLHTAGFSQIKVKQEYLALLFQSNTLRHLKLIQCGLPKSVRLPPSPIRCLTLSLRDGCKLVEPLLGHCGANLEALDFTGHLPQPLGPTTRPLFPKLRKLRFFLKPGSIHHLDTLISLSPQLEHLEVDGFAYFLSRLSALPASLNRLSIGRWMINDGALGTRRFVRLPHLHITHLHITHYHHLAQGDHKGSVIPVIQRTFPNITSLDLDIKWNFRNLALLLARHLPNVARLKLAISSWSSTRGSDISPYHPYFAGPGGPLASLHLFVRCASKHDMDAYKIWVIDTLLGPDPGLGGPYLQEVKMVFDNSTRSVVQRTTRKGGCLQSEERKEDRMFWVYSHGNVSEGPCVEDWDSLGDWGSLGDWDHI